MHPYTGLTNYYETLKPKLRPRAPKNTELSMDLPKKPNVIQNQESCFTHRIWLPKSLVLADPVGTHLIRTIQIHLALQGSDTSLVVFHIFLT